MLLRVTLGGMKALVLNWQKAQESSPPLEPLESASVTPVSPESASNRQSTKENPLAEYVVPFGFIHGVAALNEPEVVVRAAVKFCAPASE